MSVPSEHPLRQIIEGYSLGCLDDDGMVRVEEHLAVCSTCAAIADATQDDDFCLLLRKHGDVIPAPQVVAQTQRHITELREAFVDQTELRLGEILGEGGMGVVFKAERSKSTSHLLNRTVAVKTLSPQRLDQSDVVKRFKAEVQAMAKVRDHSQVVQVLDDGVVHLKDNTVVPYAVMEFVEGENLSDRVKREGPLSPPVACRVFRQSVHALQALLRANVVHRDIKPGNFIVTSGDHVKLVDFGLASLNTNESKSLTQSTDYLGTVDYQSPEQARDPRSADVRSDIYSLGCTLYFMLVGQPPFDGGNRARKIQEHLNTPPQRVNVVRPEVPRELSDLVDRMLAKSPDQRFKNPDDILTALDRAERQFATIGTERSSRRRLIVFGLVAAVAFVALGAAILYRILTDFGEVEISGGDASLRVRVQERGRTVRVLDRSGEAVVRLPTGKYELTLLDDESEWELVDNEVILRRGLKEVVRVRRRPASIVAIKEKPPSFPSTSSGGKGDLPALVAQTSLRVQRNHWYDLLELVDVQRHAVRGPWRKTSTGLRTARKQFSRIAIPFIPTGSYEILASFVRDEGRGELNFTLPVAGRFCQFTLDQDANYPSLDLVRGNSLRSEREFRVVNHREYELRVIVNARGDQADIRIELDRQPYVAWSGAVGELDHVDANWWVPENSFSFGVHESDAGISQFDIRVLDGDLVRCGSFVEAEPIPRESWVDLLALVDLQRHNSRGTWTNGRDGLRVRGDEFARLLLPVETHGDFEVDLAFTWESGKDEVNCIFPVGRGSCMLSFTETYEGLQHLTAGGTGKVFYSSPMRDPFQAASYDVLLRLEQDSKEIHITADVNKHRHVDCRHPQWERDPGNPAPVVMRNDWSLPHHAFGIGAHRDSVHFRRARFRPLDDQARLLHYVAPTIVTDPPRQLAETPQPKDVAGGNGDLTTASQRNGLIGEYFSGVNFGRLLLTRVDAQVDWYWGDSAPAANLPADDFSVRWTGWLKAPQPGRYRLVVLNDDGARLWIDDRLVIDDWVGHLVTRNEVEVEFGEGPHRLRLEYFENERGNAVSLRWRMIDGFDEQPIPPAVLFTSREAAENGARFTPDPQTKVVLEEVFTGQDFSRLVERRNCSRIAWTQSDTVSRPVWEQGTSIRWTSRLQVPKPGQYQLIVAVDDGVRLWIDNQLVIDDWNGGEMRRLESPLQNLTTNPVSLRVEYFNNPGTHGAVSVRWRQVGGFPEQEIPAGAFRPNP